MEHDAYVHGAIEQYPPGSCGSTEDDLQPQLFDTPPVLRLPSAGAISFRHSGDCGQSGLIEESWASSRSAGECAHDLEHRLRAQEYEGLRLGRELHDSTAQLLLSLRLSVAHLKRAYDVGGSNEILEEICETVRQIDEEIRAFSHLHYPAELGKGGLVAALNTLVRGFADRTGLKIMFKAVCDHIPNGEASVALLRVAQEALMNVHRHAQAHLVRVSLLDRGGRLELSVQDDGKGLPDTTNDAMSEGLGLQGMRHRVERLGGKFSLKRLKRGTKLMASLQVDRSNQPADKLTAAR